MDGEAAYALWKVQCGEPAGPYLDYSPKVSDEAKEILWRAATSFVYFARATESGRIKIGRSTQVAKRIDSLHFQSESGVEILGWLPETFLSERMIHGHLAKSRHRGEWFTPTKEVRRYVAYVQREWGRRI